MRPTVNPVSGAVVEACVRQWARIADAVERAPDQSFAAPTRLPGWRLSELVAHLVSCAAAFPEKIKEPAAAGPPIDAGRYLLFARGAADLVPADAARATPSELKERLRAAVATFASSADTAGLDQLVSTRFGPMRAADFLLARCVEGVAHGLDLDVEPHPCALKAAVKTLLGALAAKAPGKAVEVRVPPYAAVQCVAGPRHTRGTPSNVVECDPVTWVELATGRVAWSEAVEAARVRASGERADLAGLLPLV